jgi:PTS system ascorbate-specific IIA component
MLTHYLTAATVRLRVTVPDWQAAIQAAGGLLVEHGVCTPGYVAAMIQAMHDLGPYSVLAPGLALAHARPEAGMLTTGISLVTLVPPVAFGSQENDPVSILFAFGSVDSEGHMELLAALAQFLGDEQNQARIRAARTFDEVLLVLREYENKQ